ncbi:lytic murein transglycosylase B [Aliidiomarina minuta]|uniref:Lytic murein transglycosylase B n=1 Tax=Aliidiomarina minuta TaxID=880057 RepID=A0A432W5L0_9GAMM|nr:lytic murein transglycosylase B [Aliidiomarina minuta]RUO25276.1 lytic murein transglycosylase B [Aliidiomarina minuta]
MKKYIPAWLTASVCALSLTFPAQAEQSPQELQQAFTAEMIAEHDFTREEVEQILAQAELNDDVLNAIQRPWEAKPWHEYYPIFLTERRIERGVQFWQEHEQTLNRASKEYGVPPEIIVAVIGVETFYGEYMGNYRVLDALYTLGFYYPPRQNFFRSELGEFLRLARNENLELGELKGSYAGAMGFGQFISSSYHHYAVDFDGDGIRDLFNNPVDAIGSVANYFARHNWRAGEPVAIAAWPNRVDDMDSLTSGRRQQLTHTVGQLHEAGVDFVTQMPEDTRARLFQFEQQQGHSYWVGLPNFYSITRYNHSPLYAMAVFLLSEELRHAYAR